MLSDPAFGSGCFEWEWSLTARGGAGCLASCLRLVNSSGTVPALRIWKNRYTVTDVAGNYCHLLEISWQLLGLTKSGVYAQNVFKQGR